VSKVVVVLICLGVAMVLFKAASGLAGTGAKPGAGWVFRLAGMAAALLGLLVIGTSMVKVIDAGRVGVKHAFGRVSASPLLPGIRFVEPWSTVEYFSTREEQFPESAEDVEQIDALSREQMGMKVDVALRWQIDPQLAPRIFRDIGTQERIEALVKNAIRNGVRDGMVRYSINDIAERNRIAAAMEAEVDSALLAVPQDGGQPFKIARVTAFFLRNLQPPPQVVQAINEKIAQEQRIQTEQHRVEVARLQSEQQRLLNQTLTPEALTKQYLEVLEQLRTSNNMVLIVPTEGGVPLLSLEGLRKNVQ
jgi:regulator of protease activity HflC (stomatin/prohibitin superfamily)